jgi:transposase
MPRFKTPDYGLKMIPVDFQRQVLPGSFEFALCHLVDKELDLSALRSRFRNDAGGAPAFDPAVLLKIVLLAYSRGLVSSRSIEAACRHNVLFMAVSGDACPHFTTLAAFVSELGDEVARLFAQVLVVCDRQKLIGRALFAIDGVKLPSNASKEKSGTRADFERQAAKMEAAVKAMMERQVAADALPTEDGRSACHPHAGAPQSRSRPDPPVAGRAPGDRQGSKGSTRLSNRTDNESAKMATGKGVIQGYTGVAAVDDQAQIILDAQAHGTGSEQELLLPVVEATAVWRKTETVLCADAGYHSETNLAKLAESQVDAYICDNGYRHRDPRYAEQAKHKAKPDPLWDKSPKAKKAACFTPADFQLAEDRSHCICPAGKRLYGNGKDCTSTATPR